MVVSVLLILPSIFIVICHRDDMNFPFTVTPSSKYLCLRDVVELTCTAQISATWRSDDILGPRQSIDFLNGDSINKSVTVGDGTGVLIETDPRIVTSLSFNLNTDGVDTHCTDSQLRTTTTKSSVQPGEFQFILILNIWLCCCVLIWICVCLDLCVSRFQDQTFHLLCNIDVIHQLVSVLSESD